MTSPMDVDLRRYSCPLSWSCLNRPLHFSNFFLWCCCSLLLSLTCDSSICSLYFVEPVSSVDCRCCNVPLWASFVPRRNDMSNCSMPLGRLSFPRSSAGHVRGSVNRGVLPKISQPFEILCMTTVSKYCTWMLPSPSIWHSLIDGATLVLSNPSQKPPEMQKWTQMHHSSAPTMKQSTDDARDVGFTIHPRGYPGWTMQSHNSLHGYH